MKYANQGRTNHSADSFAIEIAVYEPTLCCSQPAFVSDLVSRYILERNVHEWSEQYQAVGNILREYRSEQSALGVGPAWDARAVQFPSRLRDDIPDVFALENNLVYFI